MNLLGFVVLIVLGHRFVHRLKDGDIFLLYLIWYPANRILVESMRFDAWTVGDSGLATAQLVSLVLIVAAVFALFLRHRPGLRIPANP